MHLLFSIPPTCWYGEAEELPKELHGLNPGVDAKRAAASACVSWSGSHAASVKDAWSMHSRPAFRPAQASSQLLPAAEAAHWAEGD